MILLDTDVMSGLMRLHQEPKLGKWLAAQRASILSTSTITLFEIRSGIERLPIGKKRNQLETQLGKLLAGALLGRVTTFDESAADAAGRIRARQLAGGRNVAVADSQIAGIALANGWSIATRNIKDFDKLGIALVNPWQP